MPMHDCHTTNTELLWTRFREGHIPAFETIMQRYYQDLYNYGSRFSRDPEMVKDVIQDLFLSLWKNREGLNDTGSVKYYLLKSLRRRLGREINRAKHTTQLPELYFDAGFNLVLPVDHNVVLQEKLTELSFKVRSVLEKLSKRQQEIIYLRFYMEADIDDIAMIMELNRQSVYNLLHDALRRFKSLTSLDYFTISFSLLLMLGCSLLGKI
jgi:RNA polymerase sigma factor (sigma-70 family)